MARRILFGCLAAGFAGAFLAWSCSQKPPKLPQPSFAQEVLGVPPERSERPALESAEATVLRLEEFAPLLSQPELSEVQELAAAEEFAQAADKLQVGLAGPLKEKSEAHEYWFQLGRLQELAERPKAASVAFRNAAKGSWPLSEYARYFLGRSLLAAGDPATAVKALAARPPELPFSERRELLLAQAAASSGDVPLALKTLQASLGRPELSFGWSQRALLLAELLEQEAKKLPPGVERTARIAEGLSAARRVSLKLAGTKSAGEALERERDLLALLSREDVSRLQPLTAKQQLSRMQSLTKARKHSDALVVYDELAAQLKAQKTRFDEVECEARLLRNKALFGTKKYTAAVDGFGDVIARCKGSDRLARALYLAGKYAVADKRHSQAIRHFSELEKRAGSHRLADDARLLGARSYLKLGDESSFTRLLSSMAEDYPKGDMVLDGVFELALRRIERSDWAGAAVVLERGLKLAIRADAVRDHEWAGRERYFLGRAKIELGQTEAGLSDFESIIRERPLSYYMQHAFSRLMEVDQARALAARESALERTAETPFEFAIGPEFSTPEFQRTLALMRQGELKWAQRELDRLEVGRQRSPELLWSIALLYSRAGSAKLSHTLARSRLTDWLSRWPTGDWEKAWQLAFPRPYRPLVSAAAKRFELPESLIYAVMREESGFDEKVISHADAYGLMQLIRPTAKHYSGKLGIPFSIAALTKPRVNIQLGAFVLKDFQRYFPNNPVLGIPGYNAGPSRPRRWLRQRPSVDFDVWVELIPFRETRRYAKRVLASRGVYAFLYESRDSKASLLPRKLHPDP